MEVRRLTTAGIAAFHQELLKIKADPTRPVPDFLLNDPQASEPTALRKPLARDLHTTRLSLGHALDSAIGTPPPTGLLSDTGLWGWLTLYLFDTVCPPQPSGARRIRAMARYILEGSEYTRYYRHLLVSAYLAYAANRDDPGRAMALLCQPPSTPGEIVEQIVGRQEFIGTPTIAAAVTTLYYDPATGKPKRGSSGKGAGTPRRLAAIIAQFDRTWDLRSMPPDDFIKRLPKEFNRFRE
jgi:hypothetical protein